MNAFNDLRSSTDRAASEEAAIRRQLDAVIEALRTEDLESLGRLYTTDVVSFDVEPPLQHVGTAAKLANWTKVFQFFETVNYEIRDLTLTIGADVAYGHAFARLSGTTRSGVPVPGMWVRVTYGLRKLGDTWLIAHDQVSVPLDIATGKGVVDLYPDEHAR
ncbi:YybH family protein [Nocardia tengchongensis]|uniref:YybH family protein n=1 Tax=Nocardia tengchongensis TaxID=2055889 RepID=UPI0036BDDF11